MMFNKTIVSMDVLVTLAVVAAVAPGVSSVITRHSSAGDFLKGDVENIVIDSTGTLRLARRTVEVDCGDLLKDVWAINALQADGRGALYLGTGPNGKVLRLLNEQAVQVYPRQTPNADTGAGVSNLHIFALGLDVADRLLIGVSGETGKLVRLGAEIETVFEHERVQYIYAIRLDADNNIYLGTGPEGLIFKLDPFCQAAEIFYDAKDKNILSLAMGDGVLYAGSDERGVVYRLPLDGSAASVLYHSEQSEIAALLTDADGTVYAAATSAAAAAGQVRAASAALTRAPGRPDSPAAAPGNNDKNKDDGNDEDDSGKTTATLNTANSADDKDDQPQRPQPSPPSPPTPRNAGQIYKITPDGFVTSVFSEMAVFYAMVRHEDKLWLGTGGKGQLFAVDAVADEKSIAYEDKLSSQITAMATMDDGLYLGLSNPARLVRLEKGHEPFGIFWSAMIDAGQPARWGSLQLEADLPAATAVAMTSRSGNVDDPDDPTLSAWSDEVALTGPTRLDSPVGRFLQYRLTLKTGKTDATPRVRQAAVSHVVPNVAPRVTSVRATRSRDKSKPGVVEINFAAEDDNKDELIYTIDFRQVGRTRWITLTDDLAQPKFEWDSRTVADGCYEVRITADDRKGNSPATALTGSRVSDPFVIDNTPPTIEALGLDVQNGRATLRLRATDALTVIGKVAYTVNSNDQWISVLPDDLIYDAVEETFTIEIDDLEPGSNVIAVQAADDVGNTRYVSYDVDN